MGSKSRREYPLEFKREAVLLWEATGRPQMDEARELGIQRPVLRRWQKAEGRLGVAACGDNCGEARGGFG